MIKIKFKLSNGDLICAGHFQGLTANGQDEAVEDYDGPIPDDIEQFRRTAPGVIDLKPQSEIDDLKDKRKTLTPSKFMQKFNNKFPTATEAEKFLAKAIAQLSGNIREKATD